MSVFKLKSLISTFIEQSRGRVDKDGTKILEDCPQANLTASRLTKVRDRVDSLDSTLKATTPCEKTCHSRHSVQKKDKTDKNYPQLANDITEHEKAFSSHLMACSWCHMVKGQYCVNGFAMGRIYDALLLGYDDAQARREDYQLRIDRACISGRSVY